MSNGSSAGPGVGTGPMPLPGGTGGGLAGSSYGTGGQQAPLQPATTSGPSALPGPSRFPRRRRCRRSRRRAPGRSTARPRPGAVPAASPQTLPAQHGGPHGGQHGPYTGPQQVSSVPAQNTPTLADAVKAAHQEGQDFGESIARDAPALWLEAVLARKPRMPSDLEARLLQGSSLPIDFLLHDEVRHALRRGFWDALERSRR